MVRTSVAQKQAVVCGMPEASAKRAAESFGGQGRRLLGRARATR